MEFLEKLDSISLLLPSVFTERKLGIVKMLAWTETIWKSVYRCDFYFHKTYLKTKRLESCSYKHEEV